MRTYYKRGIVYQREELCIKMMNSEGAQPRREPRGGGWHVVGGGR